MVALDRLNVNMCVTSGPWRAIVFGRHAGNILIQLRRGLAMESDLVELAVLLLSAWLVCWFVVRVVGGSLGWPGQSAEPGDYAGRPARLRPRPGRGSAAVALAEPDEEEDKLP